jgi:adenosylmethionine---8-amino-7-oxononanoate aminotransferase
MTTNQLRQLDKQHIWHPFTPMKPWLESDPLVITRAEGMYLYDSDGNRYLDGVSSLWCNVHGHRVPEIDAAIRAQLDKVAHTTMLGLANEPASILAGRLMQIVPKGLSKIFYSDSGATATEIAFKMAAQYWFNVGKPQKCEFIGFSDAYHGDTVGAMSIGRVEAFHRPYAPLLFKVHFAPSPALAEREAPVLPLPPGEGGGAGRRSQVPSTLDNRANERTPSADPHPDHLPVGEGTRSLSALKRLLDQHASRIAAICIEPIVQGAGGMLIQPSGFLREVRRLADEFDTLLICDEVATGFGRTGRMFACEHEGVSPDLMCVGKGITGGYLPLAATLATQRIFDAFLGDPSEGKTFYHGHTYTGNPLACAAAIASLDLFEKHDLVRQVQAKSEILAEMLRQVSQLPRVKQVRQKGFMVGIELAGFHPKVRMSAQVCARVRKRGVILRPLGDVIILMPPLAMAVEDLRVIVEAVVSEIRTLG